MAKHKSKGGHVELPADVAVLPLRDVVVYPHMVIPLFVGREKSIRALDHATQNDQPILLVAQRSADVDDQGPDEMYEIGTLANILQLLKLPDGTVKVLVEGAYRVHVGNFLEAEDFYRSSPQRMEETMTLGERETDVLRQANRMLREEESVRQADLNRLQSELDFFRRLAGTGGVQEGLDVYHVDLQPTDSGRVFQFVVTLTQNIRRASVISGQVRVEVEGVRDDRPLTLGWDAIGDGQGPAPAFRFKYFQQLEGYLALPEGFGPTRLVLTLDADDRRSPVQRGYDWSDMLESASAPDTE